MGAKGNQRIHIGGPVLLITSRGRTSASRRRPAGNRSSSDWPTGGHSPDPGRALAGWPYSEPVGVDVVLSDRQSRRVIDGATCVCGRLLDPLTSIGPWAPRHPGAPGRARVLTCVRSRRCGQASCVIAARCRRRLLREEAHVRSLASPYDNRRTDALTAPVYLCLHHTTGGRLYRLSGNNFPAPRDNYLAAPARVGPQVRLSSLHQ
jgi:hypothetical protein